MLLRTLPRPESKTARDNRKLFRHYTVFFTPVSPLDVSLPHLLLVQLLLLLLLFTVSLPKQTLGVEGKGVSAVSKPLL